MFGLKRKKVQVKLSVLADCVDARSGDLIYERLSGNGGLNGQYVLGVVSLLPLLPADALRQIIDAAVRYGYEMPADIHADGGVIRGHELPLIGVELFLEGAKLPGLGRTVPQGMTGRIVSLTYLKGWEPR